MTKKRIVYLFGAGATHAEIVNSTNKIDENYLDKYGLLIKGVSKRIMRKLKGDPWFDDKKDVFAHPSGSTNIELLISLFVSNMIPDEHISKLKDFVEKDIQSVLTPYRKSKFYLHKALFELHQYTKRKEELAGIISLNYDDVIDTAYRSVIKKKPYYSFSSSDSNKKNLPLLKLHGSFNWNNVNLFGQKKYIPIIPLGANKNYLMPPYSFIWSNALELLINADILRVIGCSLNSNDLGLIDLLFKAHQQRNSKINIEIIDFQRIGENHRLVEEYGFLPGFINPLEIENGLLPPKEIADYNTGNPFKTWIRSKAQSELGEKINNTKHLKKLM
ncbi:MAG: SIR2 family protein [Bacteroidales bacterium]|nr:SIR2 family protein [Bacteroidales bacterium]MCF8350630.1 SIR2 family protein [Bacteroidales bacterium]